MEVFVITDTESGWDCLIGVYSTKNEAENVCLELDENWNYDSRYIIHKAILKIN